MGRYKHNQECLTCKAGLMQLAEYERLSKDYFDATYECSNSDCSSSVAYSGERREANNDNNG